MSVPKKTNLNFLSFSVTHFFGLWRIIFFLPLQVSCSLRARGENECWLFSGGVKLFLHTDNEFCPIVIKRGSEYPDDFYMCFTLSFDNECDDLRLAAHRLKCNSSFNIFLFELVKIFQNFKYLKKHVKLFIIVVYSSLIFDLLPVCLNCCSLCFFYYYYYLY